MRFMHFGIRVLCRAAAKNVPVQGTFSVDFLLPFCRCADVKAQPRLSAALSPTSLIAYGVTW